MDASASSWDPGRYLQFGDERLRPALDLLAHVPVTHPAHVVDLGCGPGNVTRILHERWPAADVLGIDGSAAMLDRARQNAPHLRFELDDLTTWTPARTPDVLYSNAALHWLPNHQSLFPRLLSELPHGGVLAVQIPNMHAEPMRRLQSEVAATGPWAATLQGIGSAFDILAPGEYWDLLHPHAASLDMWETVYMHALQGDNAVVQWALGSSLRPYVDRLKGALLDGFLAAYAEALAPHYPRRPDGTTLLPFRRLFMVARR